MRLLAGHFPSETHPRSGEWLVAAHKDPFRPATWTATLQYLRSPDGHGVLQHAYVHKNLAAPVWSAWGGSPDYLLWKATFSSAVPASLVAAFASSLSSPVPLARAVWNIPADTRLHLTLLAALAATAAHRVAPAQSRASARTSPTLSSEPASATGVPGTAPAPCAPPAPSVGRLR
ncbi:DUF317 domain-containing protein [Streptomyces sp. NBC_01622]|nr:DUF317 domain-containing protein [Streptomyces sp. NBC_01622]